VEEADETVFWIEICEESSIYPSEKLINIKKEAEEILKILATSRKTASA
jgi:four helix bundle protein